MHSTETRVRAPVLRATFTWAGRLLGAAGLVFVFFRMTNYAEQIEFSRFGPWIWIGFFGLAVVYGAANIALTRAWQQILAYLGASVSWRQALRIYGWSQIAKYVPGNVFQFASRQALGSVAGISAKALVKSTLLEVILVVLMGGLFSVLAAPLLIKALPIYTGPLFFVASLFLVLFLVRVYASPLLAAAGGWHSFFFGISGLVFVTALQLVQTQPIHAELWPLLSGAFVLAWLAGYVTPGAPAGLGIREGILLFILGDSVPELELLLAVVLGRVITIAGDVMFMLATTWLKGNNQGIAGIE